jgi:hypothetical protein
MRDSTLLDRVQDEVSEIKEANKLSPEQPVEFTPEAFTRQGYAD